MSDEETKVQVLSVGPVAETHSVLKRILQSTNWNIHPAESRRDASEWMRQHPVGVVICEDQLPDGSWRDLMQDLAESPNHPYFIVTSGSGGRRLWMDVIEAGGFDLLAKPFDTLEVRRVIALAWRHWASRRHSFAAVA